MEGVEKPLLAVKGATSPVQEVAKAECRIHDLFAKGCVVLRREGQGTVEAVAFTGEVKQGLMDLGRVVLYGSPKLEREDLVLEHKFGDWQLEITSHPRCRPFVLLGLAACHDRPEWGARTVA